MGDRESVHLGDICRFQAGDAFPKEKQGDSCGDVPFIKVSDMNLPGNELNIVRSNNWLSEIEARNYRTHPAGAVVFAKIGEALKANRRRILLKPTIIDNNMMSASPLGQTDPRWLFYVLQNLDFNEISRGSALPYLAASDLKTIRLDIPQSSEQIAIANVLSALDEKIELNRQLNATLESLADTIFRDWFVDFGPVRRRMEGATDPVKILGGLISQKEQAESLAALFPDALSEDGIPGGWSCKTLEDALTLVYGKALPKTARVDGHVPVYGSGGIGGTHNIALASGPGIIVGRKGTVGSLFWEAGDFYAIDTVFYVQAKEGFSLEYLWQLLRTLNLDTMNTDAAVPGLNRNNAYRLEVVFSNQQTRDAFGKIAKSFRSRADAAEAESRTLAELRDRLLPRLMSGEIGATDTPRADV